MSDLIKLVLLYGGKSGEHEVSLRSAASVLANLDPARYHIIPVGMDKSGRCFQSDYQSLLSYKDALPIQTPHSTVLPSLLKDGRLALEADVLFPVVHGPLLEDGCLQGILEHAAVAYVGCGVLASAIGMDKDITRRLVGTDIVSSARYYSLLSAGSKESRERICKEAVASLGWPLFVKPCSLGSSVGIHKANDFKELLEAVEDASRYDTVVLIEEFLQGREIELAVLEHKIPGHAPRVSLAGEIEVHHPDNFYSYSAKYLQNDATKLHVPALLQEETQQRLQTIAAEIFIRLKCRGMARVDFFVNDDTGQIYFNEINTIPGFTSISMYPKLWEASGLPYQKLLDELVDLSLSHQDLKNRMVTHYY
ncbi:MAG TPA: D-alanine--D-alanine ligase family protein [Legionellaceae bacterium]|nr:D-alanine--D-alanine ligase family protein [Legionellaceae bacterium]